MKIRADVFTIRLPHPFRIAHGESTERQTVIVRVTDGGLTGTGEGALPPYYPSTAGACRDWLAKFPAGGTPPREAAAARVALNIARHDLRGLRTGAPIGRGITPPNFLTFSIPASLDDLRHAILAAHCRNHFKLKLGSGDFAWDLECLAAARAAAPLANWGVDVNGGWPVADATAFCHAFPDLAFLEEPVTGLGDWQALRNRLRGVFHPPLFADETIQSVRDLAALRGLVDGINVKLLKAGGIGGARRWIRLARSMGFRVMIGVMVETGIGRTASAQLAPLADFTDIDPPETIPTHPACGIAFDGDRIVLSRQPGLGLVSSETQ